MAVEFLVSSVVMMGAVSPSNSNIPFKNSPAVF